MYNVIKLTDGFKDIKQLFNFFKLTGKLNKFSILNFPSITNNQDFALELLKNNIDTVIIFGEDNSVKIYVSKDSSICFIGEKHKLNQFEVFEDNNKTSREGNYRNNLSKEESYILNDVSVEEENIVQFDYDDNFLFSEKEIVDILVTKTSYASTIPFESYLIYEISENRDSNIERVVVTKFCSEISIKIFPKLSRMIYEKYFFERSNLDIRKYTLKFYQKENPGNKDITINSKDVFEQFVDIERSIDPTSKEFRFLICLRNILLTKFKRSAE